MDELLSKDQDDASLNKYKASLIGDKVAPVFPNDPRKVICDSFNIIFVNDESKNIEFNPEQKNVKNHYEIAEGSAFKLKIRYYVQHDIVVGLRFVNSVTKLLVKVDEIDDNIGSFAPKAERYEFTSREDEAPSGFLARGSYKGNVCIFARFSWRGRNFIESYPDQWHEC